MALNENVLVTEQYLQDIADAIRAKIAQAGVISIYDGTVETSGGAVTDLTGTSWYFNTTIDVSTTFQYYLNFTSDNKNATTLLIARLSELTPMRVNTLSYGFAYCYTDSTGWDSQAYRTITITGGTDVTNANLIAWLEANATQI